MGDTPNKPGLVDRIRSMFSEQKQSAKQTYFRLIEKSHTVDLSPKEDRELFDAMKEAGFTDADVVTHKQILVELSEAKQAAASVPGLRSKLGEVSSRHEAAEAEVRSANVQLATVKIAYQAAADALSTANSGAGKLNRLQDQYDTTFRA